MSVETAQRQAQAQRTSFGYELQLHVVHGLLHLHGYDDREPAARAHMLEAQERIMRRASGL